MYPNVYREALVSSRADLISLQEIIKSKPELPITQCGCNLHFLPSLQNLKSLIANGHVGRIVRASFESVSGSQIGDLIKITAQATARPYEGGGVCLDLMHEVDMALWLLGPMTVLSAFVAFSQCLDIRSESFMFPPQDKRSYSCPDQSRLCCKSSNSPLYNCW